MKKLVYSRIFPSAPSWTAGRGRSRRRDGSSSGSGRTAGKSFSHQTTSHPWTQRSYSSDGATNNDGRVVAILRDVSGTALELGRRHRQPPLSRRPQERHALPLEPLHHGACAGQFVGLHPVVLRGALPVAQQLPFLHEDEKAGVRFQQLATAAQDTGEDIGALTARMNRAGDVEEGSEKEIELPAVELHRRPRIGSRHRDGLDCARDIPRISTARRGASSAGFGQRSRRLR